MSMTKTEYVLRSLAKIRHKRWELFIISRIVHGLDDDIEFVTQQLVRLSDGQKALTDLYFPQFGIHLEIKEPFHSNRIDHDSRREQDIVSLTGHRIHELSVLDKAQNKKSLEQISVETDEFVDLLNQEKLKSVENSTFISWDLDRRYSSAAVIERGYVDLSDNNIFRLQVEALRCFGFKGNGWQKGAWRIPDETGDWVWFPRLYPHFIWNNELTADGAHIFQRATSDQGRQHNASQNEKARLTKQGNVIVFAKAKDALGENVLRYVGTFLHNIEASNEQALQFDRFKTREKVRHVFNGS